MSQKNICFKSHEAESLDEKKIRSSQFSKIKKVMADQLRGEIDILIEKQHKAEIEALKAYDLYETWKNRKNEAEAEFHYRCYHTWSDETHRLGERIQVKLKAVQKYELPSKKMKEPKIYDQKKQYMKYGPSDEEE